MGSNKLILLENLLENDMQNADYQSITSNKVEYLTSELRDVY